MSGVVIEGLHYGKLHWQSDWNGDEVGYDDIDVIGFYTIGELNLYIDIENGSIIEAWFNNDDEDEDF